MAENNDHSETLKEIRKSEKNGNTAITMFFYLLQYQCY